MNKNQEGFSARRQQQRRRLTLAQYVRRRNGVHVGASGSLRNMLRRSLGIFSAISALSVLMTSKVETTNPLGLSPGDIEQGDY